MSPPPQPGVPARSFLYAPAHRWRLVEKALSGATLADRAIVDLEDAVPTDQRTTVENTLRRLGSYDGPVHYLCRVRPDHADLERDLELIPPSCAGVLIAKCESTDSAHTATHALRTRQSNTEVWALIESARAISRLADILSGFAWTGVMLGAGDLTADLGGSRTVEQTELLYARSRLVVEARAAGIEHIIDSPSPEVSDIRAAAATLSHIRTLGMTGRAAIHPNQVQAINHAFTPTAEEIEWARSVIATDGAHNVAGVHVDAATVRRAHVTLAAAERATTHTDNSDNDELRLSP